MTSDPEAANAAQLEEWFASRTQQQIEEICKTYQVPEATLKPYQAKASRAHEKQGKLADAQVKPRVRLLLLGSNFGPSRKKRQAWDDQMCRAADIHLACEAMDLRAMQAIAQPFVALSAQPGAPAIVYNSNIVTVQSSGWQQWQGSSRGGYGIAVHWATFTLARGPAWTGAIGVACVHMHNESAKKRDIALGLLRQLSAELQTRQIDIVYGDWNQGVFPRNHPDSPVEAVFTAPQWRVTANGRPFFGVDYATMTAPPGVCFLIRTYHQQVESQLSWSL